MKRSSITALSCALALFCAAGAHADEVPPPWSPFGANLWAGVALDYLDWSGSTLNSSNAKLGFSLGGDLGFRFSPELAVVALGEFAPIVSSDTANNRYLLGGGLRFNSSPLAQFLIGAGYASLSSGGGSTSGWGVRLMGFSPAFNGFGPYVQFAFDSFGASGATLRIFSLNAGISYSY